MISFYVNGDHIKAYQLITQRPIYWSLLLAVAFQKPKFSSFTEFAAL